MTVRLKNKNTPQRTQLEMKLPLQYKKMNDTYRFVYANRETTPMQRVPFASLYTITTLTMYFGSSYISGTRLLLFLAMHYNTKKCKRLSHFKRKTVKLGRTSSHRSKLYIFYCKLDLVLSVWKEPAG